jgi:hypothetical protein
VDSCNRLVFFFTFDILMAYFLKYSVVQNLRIDYFDLKIKYTFPRSRHPL